MHKADTGYLLVDLSPEGRPCHLDELLPVGCAVGCAGLECELGQLVEGDVLGLLEALGHQPGVESVHKVQLGLTEELADQQDCRSRAVTGRVILQLGW